MATPIINNLMLTKNALLVLPDEGDKLTTGTVEQTSKEGSAKFFASAIMEHPTDIGSHVLFIREMTTEVEIDEVEYLVMPIEAIVGIIPT